MCKLCINCNSQRIDKQGLLKNAPFCNYKVGSSLKQLIATHLKKNAGSTPIPYICKLLLTDML